MRKITKEPRRLLHTKCKSVTNFKEARAIAKELIDAIKSVSKEWNRWLGFAANQIGYSKRIIALRSGRNKYEILINPRIVKKRVPFPYIESCYSSQKKEYFLVKRYLWAWIEYQDLNGNKKEKTVFGPSEIYHELDHLNGLMVSDIGKRIR